ncbi:MAG: mitochondrial small ribosomal subunit protein uS17m [Methylococcaceae bacterium]|nr:mitochondrial small ribosomal subunit protein uS17m [Methylococcaceae bacterium]
MNLEDNALLKIPTVTVGRVTKINPKQKMIKVSVERTTKHPLYGKILRRTKNINAHWDNEQNIYVGDMVAVMECRPISKIKHHTFVKKIT